MNGDLSVGSINGSGFAPTNLVINPEFTINQRGAATRTTTSSAYNFDRWYYDGTNLLQGVENNNLRATTYVLNWEGSSTCSYSLNTAAASGQGSESYTSISKGGTITIASVGSNNLWLKFTSDLGNLNKVMLVQGVETSIFVARPYGTEISLCERYCQTLDSAGGTDRAMFSGVAFLNNTIIGSYTFAVMRVAPTITITNPTQIDVVTSAVTSANNTLSFGEITPKSCQPAVSNSGTPFTAGHGAVIRFDGASIVLSAEL
jgi:hypothetical protein